jgi:hypothetical protein
MEQSLVADQKDLSAAEPAGAGPHLAQHAPAENDLGYLKLVIMQCIVLMFFHYMPFMTEQLPAT